MNGIDLSKFCGRERGKYRLNSPFSRAGYTWATDGIVMLRVSLREDVPEVDEAPHAERVWTDYAGEFIPVASFNIPEPETVQCNMCDGRGTEHDCPDCTCKCGGCDGSGLIEAAEVVSIGKSTMKRRYAVALMTLPALEVEIPDPAAQRMHFRFDGGQGILMLMRSRHSYTLIADLLTGVL